MHRLPHEAHLPTVPMAFSFGLAARHYVTLGLSSEQPRLKTNRSVRRLKARVMLGLLILLVFGGGTNLMAKEFTIHGTKGSAQVGTLRFSLTQVTLEESNLGAAMNLAMQLADAKGRSENLYLTVPAPANSGEVKGDLGVIALIGVDGLDSNFYTRPEKITWHFELRPNAPQPPTQEPNKAITPAQAMTLAAGYLKTLHLSWGKPTSVSSVDHSAAILVTGPDGKQAEESWENCYYVQYPTPEKQRALTGIKTVIVTRDGKKIGMPMGE